MPAEHQRLVKYPLLLEQLAKQTQQQPKRRRRTSSNDSSDNDCATDCGGTCAEELARVRRCVERTREILESIDRRVAEAQNKQRLAEIQRNLDVSGLEKMPDSPICQEYKVITESALVFAVAEAFRAVETDGIEAFCSLNVYYGEEVLSAQNC